MKKKELKRWEIREENVRCTWRRRGEESGIPLSEIWDGWN